MKAKLIKRESIPYEALYFEFESLEGNFVFKAGQFFNLTVPDQPNTDERGNSRYFGFVNPPDQNKIAAMITRPGISTFKKFLQESEPGTIVEIDKISGEMGLTNDKEQTALFVTRGVGIAPIMSILRSIQDNKPIQEISLVYSNTKEEPGIFEEELRHMNNFKLWTPEILDKGWLEKNILPIKNPLIMVPGTPAFVMPTVKMLRETGFDQKQIRLEIFTRY